MLHVSDVRDASDKCNVLGNITRVDVMLQVSVNLRCYFTRIHISLAAKEFMKRNEHGRVAAWIYNVRTAVNRCKHFFCKVFPSDFVVGFSIFFRKFAS